MKYKKYALAILIIVVFFCLSCDRSVDKSTFDKNWISYLSEHQSLLMTIDNYTDVEVYDDTTDFLHDGTRVLRFKYEDYKILKKELPWEFKKEVTLEEIQSKGKGGSRTFVKEILKEKYFKNEESYPLETKANYLFQNLSSFIMIVLPEYKEVYACLFLT